jgi:hypothetical protein
MSRKWPHWMPPDVRRLAEKAGLTKPPTWYAGRIWPGKSKPERASSPTQGGEGWKRS